MSKRWYVVHTYSGYENRVKSDLEHRIETMGMQDRIFDIEILWSASPRLKRVASARPRIPRSSRVMSWSAWRWMTMLGRAFVTRLASPVSWAATASRSAFPRRVQQDDSSSPVRVIRPRRTSVDIQVGTSVRVTDGPLTDFDGKVSEVNTEAGKLKVTLMIFGRETPVELDFNQVAVIA